MNLKDMQRREIEFLKKIGLYSSVSLSTMQKICKYIKKIYKKFLKTGYSPIGYSGGGIEGNKEFSESSLPDL